MGKNCESFELGLEERWTHGRYRVHDFERCGDQSDVLARQYADKGITCNAIAPCYVMSKMVSEQLTAKQRAELLEKIPVHRFCEPEEIAHCTRFLCHDMSGFITGEVLDVNAGFQMD